jgi:hypothetical protein
MIPGWGVIFVIRASDMHYGLAMPTGKGKQQTTPIKWFN